MDNLTLPTGPFSVIYADPPWEYRQSGSLKGSRGMAKAHYATMTTKDICEIPVGSICTNDAILFLWATFPNIAEALAVMEAWGFTYKTAAFVWFKVNSKSVTPFWGMGQYTRANAEVCLLGIRPGTKAKRQVINHGVHQIIQSPVRRHSQKPAEARERIVQLLGDVPRVELFARERVPGWAAWGNEV